MNCVSEKIEKRFDRVSGALPRRAVGRPEQLGDDELRSSRDHLLSMLQNGWFDVGFELQGVQNEEDVGRAFSAWKTDQSSYLIRLLLLPTEPNEVPVNLAELREKHRRRIELGQLIRSASEEQARCRTLVEQANQAYTLPTSDADRVAEIRSESVAALDKADLQYLTLRRELGILQNNLDSGFARFVRLQVVEFCGSKRYVLTPLSIANALAGLPFIVWRHSVRRCSPWKVEDFDGAPFHIVNTIHSIVASCPPEAELVQWAEEWLRKSSSSESHAIAELKNNWYFVRAAIEATRPPSASANERAFFIAREYRKRRNSQSPTDILLESRDRLL